MGEDNHCRFNLIFTPPNRVPSVPAAHPKSHDYTTSH